MAVDAAMAEAARNRTPPVPQLRTPSEQMAFLVRTVQGMEKNIQEIIQNQKSLERFGETKFHNMDVKVNELTTIVRPLQHEADSVEIPRPEDENKYDDDGEDKSPPPTTTKLAPRLGQLLFLLRRQIHLAVSELAKLSSPLVDTGSERWRCLLESHIPQKGNALP
ncbi:hypothetical protein D1007_34073 [Hordeum vulgare]|nr:hypothetical protein D1007_34073 [Hordeum vulgare]